MKKIIPYIFILALIIGFFSPVMEVHAEDNINPDTDFDCGGPLGINPFSTGCLASLSNTIWVLSAKIARVGGQILDYFVYYSTDNNSYNNTFINGTWGAVRDVANIFFIITLLYIAIKTVLDLDSHGSKKMIGYVVVIALVINFSLFTTKVVIDASNILAKIFYNNITPVDSSGAELAGEAGGQKSISIGLISKYNPQQILKPGEPTYDAITFIFIALFLAGITFYTAYVFFAVALLFVARVVSLWIAMIFSPFAFISYAVPFDVPFGHKEWWDDLFKNAFLAPIFIFFLYIIVLFTDFLKDIAKYPEGADIFQKLMSIVIPFAILMILLMKAKSLATKYSGQIGSAVMSAGKMIGGLALGVGAGALALGGRTFVARGAAALSREEGAIESGKARIQYNKALEDWKHHGKKGSRPDWEQFKPAGTNIFNTLGGRINAAQSRSGEIDHARHTLDETKKKAGLEGVSDAFLSGVEKTKIENTFIGDNRSSIESDIRRGHDAKNNDVIIKNDVKGNEINAKGENDYKAKRRQAVIEETKIEDPRSIDATGELNDQGRKQVEDKLTKEFNDILKTVAVNVGRTKFKKLQDEAKETVGIPTRIASRSTSGTYDIRNLASALKADKRESFATKATIGLALATTVAFRAGLKNLAGIQAAGSPQRNITKDMAQTIADSLKNVNINVKVADSGGSHGPTAKAHAPDAGHH